MYSSVIVLRKEEKQGAFHENIACHFPETGSTCKLLVAVSGDSHMCDEINFFFRDSEAGTMIKDVVYFCEEILGSGVRRQEAGSLTEALIFRERVVS